MNELSVFSLCTSLGNASFVIIYGRRTISRVVVVAFLVMDCLLCISPVVGLVRIESSSLVETAWGEGGGGSMMMRLIAFIILLTHPDGVIYVYVERKPLNIT